MGSGEVAEFFSDSDTLKALPLEHKERLASRFMERIWLLRRKIALSPYCPAQSNDELGIRSNVARAILNWTRQFPAEMRGPLLVIALGAYYITEKDFSTFLDDVSRQFQDRGHEAEGSKRIARSSLVWSLSERTDLQGKFIHRIRAQGTADRNLKPPGVFNNFLLDAAQAAYCAAEKQTLIYYDVRDILKCLRNADCVIIDDWSLSGKTLLSELRRFLALLNALFRNKVVQAEIAEKGYGLPVLSVILPVATKSAVDAIHKACADFPLAFDVHPRIIIGCTLGPEDQLNDECASNWLHVCQSLAPQIDWVSGARKACARFFDMFSPDPREHVESSHGKYGYNECGLSVVGYSNCPDNTLPIFWRGGNLNTGTRLKPLFERVESKLEHAGKGDEIDFRIRVAAEDKHLALHNQVVAAVKEWS